MIGEDCYVNGIYYRIGKYNRIEHNTTGNKNDWVNIVEFGNIRQQCKNKVGINPLSTQEQTVLEKRLKKTEENAVKYGDVQSKIIDILKNNGASRMELLDRLDISGTTLQGYLKELKDKGVIGNGYFYIW
jgi:hypothetical protein